MTVPTAVSRSDIWRIVLENLAEELGLKVGAEFMAAVLGDAHEKIIIGGVRAGKSTALAVIILIYIFLRRGRYLQEGKEGTLIWLVAPDYNQGREEMRFLAEWCGRLGWLGAFHQPEGGSWTLQLDCGITVVTRSAQHPETLASVAPDFIGGCEAGQFSEDVREQLRLRAMEKNADIVYNGTMERDDAHEQWAWFEESAQAWQDEPTADQAAFSLPSWSNLYLYGDCRRQIEATPSLAAWCPNEAHPHGGREHPIMRREAAQLTPYVFARKIAAIPTGVQYQVYHQTTDRQDLLRPMLAEEYALPVISSAGGVDYGTTEGHPSAIAVVQVVPDARDQDASFAGPRGIAWVREVWYSPQDGAYTATGKHDPGDYDALGRARKMLSERYKVWRWMTDPNERYMARSWQGEATSSAEGPRQARINLVKTRLNLNKLFFDLNGPGVKGLYEEMQRVHERKRRDGQLVIVRDQDDRTAALEDAIEMIDGRPSFSLNKNRLRIKYEPPRAAEFVQRI